MTLIGGEYGAESSNLLTARMAAERRKMKNNSLEMSRWMDASAERASTAKIDGKLMFPCSFESD